MRSGFCIHNGHLSERQVWSFGGKSGSSRVMRTYESQSPFHYARQTGPRPVELTEKKFKYIFRSNRANRRNSFYHIYSFPKFPTWLKRFVKMECQISVRPVRPIKVHHRILWLEGIETDLSNFSDWNFQNFCIIHSILILLSDETFFGRQLTHSPIFHFMPSQFLDVQLSLHQVSIRWLF